jgi:hypothetical protein
MIVDVYWNSKKKCFSVRAMSGPDRGRVIAHRMAVYLSRPIAQRNTETVRGEWLPNAWGTGWDCYDANDPDRVEYKTTMNSGWSRWWRDERLSPHFTADGGLTSWRKWDLALCNTVDSKPVICGRKAYRC